MKVIGLIAEYNPFHNGHLYHLTEAKKRAGADAVIVVMSGDFVQRGTPALFSKRLRAKMALECGADLIVELPACFSTASAEYFAHGGVSLLDHLNCVDELWFGSECGEIEPLEAISHILVEQSEALSKYIRPFLADGLSYPAAREVAFRQLLPDTQFSSCFSQPNNLLGIEYLKALYRSNSAIKPCTLQRIGRRHHDLHTGGACECKETSAEHAEHPGQAPNKDYCSASAIRKGFLDGLHPSAFASQLPKACVRILESAWKKQGPVYPDDLSLLLKYRLLTDTPESLRDYQEMIPDIANKIFKKKNEFSSFSDFCAQLKSKELTYTRISRVLLHIVLNLSETDFRQAINSGYVPYAHVLGFRTDKEKLFSLLKENSRIPLITKLAKTPSLTETGKRMLHADILASDLYQSILTDKFKTPFQSEYQQMILKQ